MAGKKQFKKYSEYYDSIYAEKNYKKESDFVLKIIKRYSPIVVKKILSLGCGTAAHDILLAKKKYDIVGVDRSKEMLDIARRKINKIKLKNIRLIHQDIRNFTTKDKFDFAMAMFNIIGYQTQDVDMIKTLRNTAKFLKKNALFVFDCWYLPAVLKDRPVNRVKKIKKNGQLIIRETAQSLNLKKNIISINFKIKTVKNNKIITETTENHPMRFWDLPELEGFLKNNGFSLIKTCQFLNLRKKISDNNWNIFVIAKKI